MIKKDPYLILRREGKDYSTRNMGQKAHKSIKEEVPSGTLLIPRVETLTNKSLYIVKQNPDLSLRRFSRIQPKMFLSLIYSF